MPFDSHFEPAIVFVSHWPDLDRDPSGMIQRIAAVDALFSDVPRLYMHISFKGVFKHRIETRGKMRVEYLNYFLHQRHIVERLRRAPWVYIHSCINGLKIFPHFRRFGPKMIADLHGVVPEEFSFTGQPVLAKVYGAIESQIARHCAYVVVVTRRLGRHILSKYPQSINFDRIVTLPNFNFRQEHFAATRAEANRTLRLIYAGTVNKWQKVDLVIEVLARLAKARPEVRTSVFVPAVFLAEVKSKIEQLGLASRVEVDTRTPWTILQEYGNGDAGFVLRDDILLNQVAMPTKLVEYINYGLVPIVLSPDIGDFPEYGYRYLTIEDLFDADATAPARLEEMRSKNLGCLRRIYSETANSERVLRALITQHAGPVRAAPSGASAS